MMLGPATIPARPMPTCSRSLSRQPYIAEQLAKLDPKLLAKELSEWGAWDEAELADHDQNLQRILWLAACDIAEGHST